MSAEIVKTLDTIGFDKEALKQKCHLRERKIQVSVLERK